MSKITMARNLNYISLYIRLARLHAQFAKGEKDDILAMHHDSYYAYYKALAIKHILQARKERKNHGNQF